MGVIERLTLANKKFNAPDAKRERIVKRAALELSDGWQRVGGDARALAIAKFGTTRCR